jgi:NAD(P)-dependent dehydrogenase (short-subunit alcohol dehydrogenase family)
MGTLAGKVALVTGGSSGIGLASAEELIREGAFVYITGRKKAELDAAANRLGERCVSIQADISKMEDIDRIYKKIAGDGKALDVLFANAGGGSFAPLGSVTEEQYDATFTTNVKGTLFTVQKSLPHLNDGSSIILNASIAAVKGIPGLSVYSAAKAALRSFARVWMMDLRERRIRVNVISPGPIDTPGFRAAAGSTGGSAAIRRDSGQRCTGRPNWRGLGDRPCCCLFGWQGFSIYQRDRTVCRWRRGPELDELQ